MNLHVREMIAMLAVAVLGAVACGGDRATTSSSRAAERRSAAAVSPEAQGAPGCEAPEVEDVPTPDDATTRELLIGAWHVCDSPSFFGTTDETGLVIAADGHWAKLDSNGAGTAVEMTGATNRGTWALIDTSSANGPGHFQINFTGLDGRTRISPVRVIAPAKLRLDNSGAFVARYVPADVTVAPAANTVAPTANTLAPATNSVVPTANTVGPPQLVATR